MRNRIKRRDDNHAQIVAELRTAGFSVVDLSQVGGGVCDILVGAYGKNWLFEIKNTASSHGVSDSQIDFMQKWQGQSAVIVTSDDAILYLNTNNRL